MCRCSPSPGHSCFKTGLQGFLTIWTCGQNRGLKYIIVNFFWNPVKSLRAGIFTAPSLMTTWDRILPYNNWALWEQHVFWATAKLDSPGNNLLYHSELLYFLRLCAYDGCSLWLNVLRVFSFYSFMHLQKVSPQFSMCLFCLVLSFIMGHQQSVYSISHYGSS